MTAHETAPPSQPAETRRRSDYLDALRGFAALLVVFSHTSNEGISILPFFNTYGSGLLGVWLFFVLSAFLLTERLVAEFSTGGAGAVRPALIRYGIHRVLRIFPLYSLVVLGHAIAARAGWGIDLGCVDFRTWGETPWKYFWKHLLLLEGRGEVFWTIPVEFKYYFVIPLFSLAYVFVLRRRFAAACASVLGVAALCTPFYVPSERALPTLNLAAYFSTFAIGSLLAIMPRPILRAWGSKTLLVVSVIVLTTSIPLIARRVWKIDSNTVHTLGPVWALFWSTLVAYGIQRPHVHPLRCFVLLGRISFSVYLLHYPILTFLLHREGIPHAIKGSLCLLLTLPLAWLSWKFIEVPGMELGKKWGRRLTHLSST